MASAQPSEWDISAAPPGATHMGVVLHHQQVLHPPLRPQTLVGGGEAGDVFVLQQGEPVDGALVEEVLPIGRGEHLDRHLTLVQRTAVHRAVAAAANQLREKRRGGTGQDYKQIQKNNRFSGLISHTGFISSFDLCSFFILQSHPYSLLNVSVKG